jgi:hypothetical protein
MCQNCLPSGAVRLRCNRFEIYQAGARVPTMECVGRTAGTVILPMRTPCRCTLIRSAENLRSSRGLMAPRRISMKLDGGIDLNSQMNPAGQSTFPVGRDHLPGVCNRDVPRVEQMRFVQRVSENLLRTSNQTPARDVIGSQGAETWECTVGSPSFTLNPGAGISPDLDSANWVYHNPGAADINGSTDTQFHPHQRKPRGRGSRSGRRSDTRRRNDARVDLLYGRDGTSFPEGSAGIGRGTTKVASLVFDRDAPADANGTPQWWRGTVPPQPSGTKLRYKIGRAQANRRHRQSPARRRCRAESRRWRPYSRLLGSTERPAQSST